MVGRSKDAISFQTKAPMATAVYNLTGLYLGGHVSYDSFGPGDYDLTYGMSLSQNGDCSLSIAH
jgi:hypothetical protein